MGLFDLFTKEGKLARHVRRMSDPYAQPEDRDTAAKWLAEDGGERAIFGLLSRFDMSLSNQLKDRAEKDQVFELLVGLGAAAGPPARGWLQKAKHFVFPLRLVERLEGREAAIHAALDTLDGPVGRTAFEPERRKEVLTWLAEQRHPAIAGRVLRFLKDADEDVRYVAVEAILAQDGEAGRAELLDALAAAAADATRLKHRIAQAFAQRGWPVGEAPVLLPEGFVQRGDRVVAR